MESRDPENASNDVLHLNIRVLTIFYHELQRFTFCLKRSTTSERGSTESCDLLVFV